MTTTTIGQRKQVILEIIKAHGGGISSTDIRNTYAKLTGNSLKIEKISIALLEMNKAGMVRRKQEKSATCGHFFRYWLAEAVPVVLPAVTEKFKADDSQVAADNLARRLRHVASQQKQRNLGPEIVSLLLDAALAIEFGKP